VNEFGPYVLGCDARNLYRWFDGETMAHHQRVWINRLESVTLIGTDLHIIVRRGVRGPHLEGLTRRRELLAGGKAMT